MRGMFAARDIKKGETLLFVPNHLILSVDKSFQSEIGQIMKQKNLIKGGGKLNSPTMSLLGINNLQEIDKKEKSPFYHHLQV